MSELTPPKLTLYHGNFCIFCLRVTRVIKQLEIEVDVKNVWRDKQAHQDLQSATGRSTVPVLRIEPTDGKITWLSESSDIVQYLIKLSSS